MDRGFRWSSVLSQRVDPVAVGAVLPPVRRRSGHGFVEGGDADDVVDGGGHLEPGPVAVSALVAELATASDGLDPAEGFLVWVCSSDLAPLGGVVLV